MHLYLLKQLGQYRDAMAEGRWEMLGQVSQLAGSTVVCLGTGDLGASYAKKAQLLGAHTIGVKRTPAANLPGFEDVYKRQGHDKFPRFLQTRPAKAPAAGLFFPV